LHFPSHPSNGQDGPKSYHDIGLRFDPESKEWKERGVGKLKILKHTSKGTFRVLLRREQVHKIAVNHIITKDIELKPMAS
jgi:E3 SUMO-protein ligase RanBP2